MSSALGKHGPDHAELVFMYAVRALPASEAAVAEANLASCPECRREMESLRPVIASFAAWPTDLLRPATSLWGRLAQRISGKAGGEGWAPEAQRWAEPPWKEVAPGIFCKILATDAERDRVSMLVRLEPGVDYPPHRHTGVEELHLLHGELWINERKLYPGDYNRAEPGTSDRRVMSETGCTCVLMTSPGDVLG